MTALAVFVYFKYFKNDIRKFKTEKTNKIFIVAFAVMVVNMLVMLYNFLSSVVFAWILGIVMFGYVIYTEKKKKKQENNI